MSNFGGLILTNKGRALQAKVLAGATLHFNRMGIGDGNLGSTVISTLNALISEKESLDITKLQVQSTDKAIVGGILSNQDIVTGFYFREIGVFAQDPTDGEILYCYANSGAGAEYIPAGGGPDIVEKNIDVITLIANAASVTATIASGIYALVVDVGDMTTVPTTSKNAAGAIAELYEMIEDIDTTLPDNSVSDAKIGNRTINDTVTAAAGADTPTNLWSKLGNIIKSITGGAHWYDVPGMTIAAIITALGLKADSSTLTTHLADYIRQPGYVTTGGLVNVYTATLTPAMAAYTAGVALSININITNTGAATINVNGLGAKAIIDSKGNALTAGKLTAGRIYPLRYNGTAFQFQGEGGGGTALAANILAGLTATVDSGDIVGTMVDRSGTTQVASGSAVAGTTLTLTNPATGYQSITSKLSITDADFIAANIVNGKDIFGLVGTNTNKPDASGTVTPSGTAVSFTFDDGTTTSRQFLTVSGLSFPNGIKQIVILSRNGIRLNQTLFDPDIQLGSNVNTRISTIGGSATFAFQFSGNAVVSTTGFTLPIEQALAGTQYFVWGK